MTRAPAMLMARFGTNAPAADVGFRVGYDADEGAWAVYSSGRLVSHYTTRGAAVAGCAVEVRRAIRAHAAKTGGAQ